jgi:hypothetical protein
LSGGGPGSIVPGIIEALRKTRPWVLFVAIMILIGCGLMVVIALVMMAVGRFMPAETTPITGVALGLIYLVMAALYLYPGIRLLQYAAAIKRIGDTDSAHAIEVALTHQLAFWRFIGIVTLALLGIYVLIFVGVIVVGIATTATG